MNGENNKRTFDNLLDETSRKVLLAATNNETEVEIAVNAPFAYQRIRARIQSEYRRHLEKERWSALTDILRYAFPAMLFFVVISLAAFGIADYKAFNLNAVRIADFSETVFLDENSSELEKTVFGERQIISSDDVLSTILTRNDKDNLKK
ncbi:MAG: hypothetical protein H7Z37_03465 [Pyrinomonadaceae bacterium]|nr:hypothetical protein [Pyrinomonadaceae bacterium]